MTNIITRGYPRNYVSVFRTKHFIEIQTYRECPLEPTQTIIEPRVLPLNISDKELGAVLMTALQKSRWLSEEESQQVVSAWSSTYGGSIAERVRDFSYKNSYELFRYMDKCFISSFDGRIMISPQHHVALTQWIHKANNDITGLLFFDGTSFSELGNGVRLALNRCSSEETFERVEDAVKSCPPKRLRFIETRQVVTNYPCLFFYLEKDPYAFMSIAINSPGSLDFMISKSSKSIRLALSEWKHIQLQAEMLFPDVLRYKLQYQKYGRYYREKTYIESRLYWIVSVMVISLMLIWVAIIKK